MSQHPLHPPVTLRARDLVISRAGRPVVDGLSLEAEPGQALALRGPNGAGKSTLLLALAGLLAPDAGAVHWRGTDPEIAPRTLMHFLGHQSGIKPGLSVAENLAFAADVLGGARGRIDAAIAGAGLAGLEAIEAGLLSAGQIRRLALARLVVAPRPVWLLDEPTSALDDQGAAWVSALIAGHLDAGGVAILATHHDLAVEQDARVRRVALSSLTGAKAA